MHTTGSLQEVEEQKPSWPAQALLEQNFNWEALKPWALAQGEDTHWSSIF